MPLNHVLAAIAVGDMKRSLDWYGRLLGRPADDMPMNEAAEWRLVGAGRIQLVLDAERAGKSLATIGTDDIDELAEAFTARGFDARATPPGSGMFRLDMLTFAEDERKS